MLLGSDVSEVHQILDQRCGGRGQPFATRSPLGWVIRGPMDRDRAGLRINAINWTTDQLLVRLYDADFRELSDPEEPALSLEDDKALKMVSSSAQLKDNHYKLAAPWERSFDSLPDSRTMASKRLLSPKKKLLGNETLKQNYTQCMTDHLSKGYISPANEDKKRWFLPHHVVLNPRKPEKIRIVSDFQWRVTQ